MKITRKQLRSIINEAFRGIDHMEEDRRGGGRGYTDMDVAIIRDFATAAGEAGGTYLDAIDYYLNHASLGLETLPENRRETLARMRIDKMLEDRIVAVDATDGDFRIIPEATQNSESLVNEGASGADIQNSIQKALERNGIMSGIDLIDYVMNDIPGHVYHQRVADYMDEMMEDGVLRLNVEEDEWSLA